LTPLSMRTFIKTPVSGGQKTQNPDITGYRVIWQQFTCAEHRLE
jgi:hypothetical protein